jgi:hypothetical protein
MIWAQLAVTLISLAVCSFAPGFLLVKNLRWRPLEKVCGAIAASLILIYLFAWAVFCFAPGWETTASRAAGCLAAALAIVQWRSIRTVVRSFGAKQALTGLGFLLIWSLPALAMIHNYSGAGWGGDWLEHFQRALFFLHHLPKDLGIATGYLLPARPPMMNVLDAFFMAQVEDRFEIHQLVIAALNLIAFLPCCLMMRALVKNSKSRYLPLTALFALNPMMMENAWYPWTKLFAAFYILFALWLYLAGLRKNDSLRIVGSFVCLAAGLLIHYSAGPYIVFLAGHYLLRTFPHRPNRLRELAVVAISCALLLATWFGWSLNTYGSKATLASNSSVIDAQRSDHGALSRIAGNLLGTTIPAILSNPGSLSMFNQPNKWGELRDNAFVVYQTNLIFGMGLFGGPLVLCLLYQWLRSGRAHSSGRIFWPAFILVSAVLGIAVVGESGVTGVAHLTLLPLDALGITLIAASFPWKRLVAGMLIAGCLADFSLGIFLNVRIQSLDNSPQKIIYDDKIRVSNDQVSTGESTPDLPGNTAWLNWFWKNRDRLFTSWINYLESHPQTPAIQRVVARFSAELGNDVRNFGGWYGRHGGRFTFIGDDVRGPSFEGIDIPTVLFLLLFLGLMRAFWRQAMSFAPVHLPTAIPAKKAPARKLRAH